MSKLSTAINYAKNHFEGDADRTLRTTADISQTPWTNDEVIMLLAFVGDVDFEPGKIGPPEGHPLWDLWHEDFDPSQSGVEFIAPEDDLDPTNMGQVVQRSWYSVGFEKESV